MGYYTTFTLKITSPKTSTLTEETIIHNFREQYECAKYALSEDGYPIEPCKWYECESELKAFSKSYPEHLFLLVGEGEESGDLWKLYVKNGKCQRASARVIYDEYDESKLA
jgi:hypothetical protein